MVLSRPLMISRHLNTTSKPSPFCLTSLLLNLRSSLLRTFSSQPSRPYIAAPALITFLVPSARKLTLFSRTSSPPYLAPRQRSCPSFCAHPPTGPASYSAQSFLASDRLAHDGHGTSFTKKAGNLRRGKVENRQAFVLEQPRLSLLNR